MISRTLVIWQMKHPSHDNICIKDTKGAKGGGWESVDLTGMSGFHRGTVNLQEHISPGLDIN